MPDINADISIRIEVLNQQRQFLSGTVDIEFKPQDSRQTMNVKRLDASEDIDVGGLQRTPQGMYQVTVTPTDVFKPVSKFVTIRILGGVAESQGASHRPEELIDQQRSRAEQSEQFYSEALKAFTEAITTTFSEALGAVAPHVGELAKDWMKELLGEAIIPSVEHNIEGDAESVLKWSRSNLAAGCVHEVPDQITENQGLSGRGERVSVSCFPEQGNGHEFAHV